MPSFSFVGGRCTEQDPHRKWLRSSRRSATASFRPTHRCIFVTKKSSRLPVSWSLCCPEARQFEAFVLKPCTLKLLWFKCQPGESGCLLEARRDLGERSVSFLLCFPALLSCRGGAFQSAALALEPHPSRMNAETVDVIVSFLAPGEDVWPADPRTIDLEEDVIDYMTPESFFFDDRKEPRPMSEMRQWMEEVWAASARSLQALAASNRQFMMPCSVYLKVMQWLEEDMSLSMIRQMKDQWCEPTPRMLPVLSGNEFMDRVEHFGRQNTSRRLREMLSEIDTGLRSGAMDEWDVYELLGTDEAEDPLRDVFEEKRLRSGS